MSHGRSETNSVGRKESGMAKAATNEEFKKRVLAQMVKDNEFPESLLTTRQASKFRMKKGLLYWMWKALPSRKRVRKEVGGGK